MKHNYTTIYFSFLFAILLFAQFNASAQQKSLAEAKLVVDSYSLKSDSTILFGVLINLKDEWHIYWRNPGDSGMPTDIEFSLPDGIVVSEIKFPIPKIFTADEIVNYGYSHQVLLMNELFIPKKYSKKEISITAKLTSLICKDLCKAFDTTVTISLDMLKNFITDEKISGLFESTKKMIPKQNQKLNIIAESKSDNVYLKLFVNQNENQNIKGIQFYSYEVGIFRNLDEQVTEQKENFFEILLEPDPFRIKKPTSVNGIIVIEEEIENDLSRKAFEITVPIIELL